VHHEPGLERGYAACLVERAQLQRCFALGWGQELEQAQRERGPIFVEQELCRAVHALGRFGRRSHAVRQGRGEHHVGIAAQERRIELHAIDVCARLTEALAVLCEHRPRTFGLALPLEQLGQRERSARRVRRDLSGLLERSKGIAHSTTALKQLRAREPHGFRGWVAL
jgi:hypothetical protein